MIENQKGNTKCSGTDRSLEITAVYLKRNMDLYFGNTAQDFSDVLLILALRIYIGQLIDTDMLFCCYEAWLILCHSDLFSISYTFFKLLSSMNYISIKREPLGYLRSHL